MSDLAIQVQGLSKRYKLGQQKKDNLRDTLAGLIRRRGGSKDSYFHALDDVSFDIHQGEAVAIVGKNGAGKSTLLKVISRITAPTSGKITIHGRVASLLEVGTGFHPELTGRENIFLNGTILGMRRDEVKAKLDEIIAFSGVERFVDTAVKHYSSGMYVRLAFAVAAHLEPEILIIDEVLAVGDAEFQKKCLGKMDDVAKSGRTVLFVSHNMKAVKELCSKGILLQQGKVTFSGSVNDTVSRYLNTDEAGGAAYHDLKEVKRSGQAHQVIFEHIRFSKPAFDFGEDIDFELGLSANAEVQDDNAELGIAFTDQYSNMVYHLSNEFISRKLPYDGKAATWQVKVSNNQIKPGIYHLTLFLRINGQIQDWLRGEIAVEIQDGNPYNLANTSKIQGLIYPPFTIEPGS